MGIKQFVKKMAETPEIKRYEAELEAKRGSYGQWLLWEHARQAGDDVERAADAGLREQYFGPEPGKAIQDYFVRHPETMLLYGDEDVKEEKGEPGNPWFRPDWSPELLESCFYLGSLIAVRRSFLEKALPDWREEMGAFAIPSFGEAAGREDEAVPENAPAVLFRNESPDGAYRSRIFSLCEKAGGWERGSRAVTHLPGILNHCGSLDALRKFADPKTGQRHGSGSIPEGLVSVILPSKDHPELLGRCLEALHGAMGYGDLVGNAGNAEETGKTDKKKNEEIAYEVIVVDNGSSAENRARIEAMPGIRYLYEPMEFHFSKMCNLGAAAAKGRFLLFLNDDVELLPESCLGRMLALADREGVGSVGLKLYYPGTTLIQHAGITSHFASPVHQMLLLDDREEYYFGKNRGLQNVIAVSAACVMLQADRFREAGGFPEDLRVAFNDVALGFRLQGLGYRNVCACDAYAYHHESLTRGSDQGEEKRARLSRERDRLYELFPQFQGNDPYYSAFLGKMAADTKPRPACETTYNACQNVLDVQEENLSPYREDPCLMLAVEACGEEVSGFVVVLGDDNACYERRLLLQKETGESYGFPLDSQYRPDLEERMTDQKHVALSGFWVRLEKDVLAPGRYRIGCLVKRKVGNVRLLRWSDRSVKVE